MHVTLLLSNYLLTFNATGTTYPLSHDDARRLLREYPVVSATRNRVTLRGDDGYRCVLRGTVARVPYGRPAFKVERHA